MDNVPILERYTMEAKMNEKIISSIVDLEDEAIKLLNPEVGFISLTGVIENFSHDRAEVRLKDGRKGSISITEFYPNRKFKQGDSYTFLQLKDGENPTLSVSHPNLIISIISGIAPEFRSGIVREFGVVRRVGIRSKVAVGSTVENLDPVGAFVGKAANRIKYMIEQLNGERVDIVPYHPQLEIFIANSLGVKVNKVTLVEGLATVEVPKHQLQAALGGGGLNVALAAKLTNSKITIVSGA